MQDSAAESIAEELLYITGKALLEADFRMFSECFRLPQMMETVDGRRLIATESEFLYTFNSVRRHLHKCGVVDFARTVVSAKFLDADTIGSTHVSILLGADGQERGRPYPVYSVIRRHGNIWQIVSSLYAILDNPAYNEALMATPGFHSTDH
ncbi:hypothetical protein CEP88_12720 [Roseobacter denitrificans]|uniref:DUF4440 domain-containing protein n=1 Tax=Roseobacter denitrificans (strain ATCC 33942 / OCh 114) TaxID=375451 RepID=Q16CT9_ROSDO|nr:hypothetical protein [Roseobacter denitrificans]ABG30204.1 hypothetical protein RD1_0497 [Roseobacter denitrificans OCh 114]AVL53391.1 hypothetical protein CEP88_12720 [Roseobacter denitrificans]SFF70594.1 hypothetical protein SAMN05443635_101214 [Roseobacter denitrificans OCh 114]